MDSDLFLDTDLFLDDSFHFAQYCWNQHLYKGNVGEQYHQSRLFHVRDKLKVFGYTRYLRMPLSFVLSFTSEWPFTGIYSRQSHYLKHSFIHVM